MGLKKIVKKVKKGVKTVAKVAVPAAAAYLGGNALGAAFGGSPMVDQSSDSQSPVFGAIGDIWGAISKSLPQISSAAGAIAPFYSAYSAGEGAEKANQWTKEASAAQMDYGREMAGRQESFQRESVANQQAFNSAQTAQQMDFQREMAGTARQREVSDLRAAGLNPMMAHMNGAPAPMGASAASSAASGASGGGTQLPSYQNVQQTRLQSAAATASVVAALRKSEAETEEIRSRSDVNRAQVENLGQSTTKMVREAAILSERLHEHMPLERAELIARTALQGEHAGLAYADVKHRAAQIHQIDNIIREIEAKVKLTDAERRLVEAELPKALNEARAQDSWYMREVAPYTGEVGKVMNSAGSASWVYRNLNRR